MLISLKSFFHNFRIYPLRGLLTVLTITIGVATLIISTSLNMDITKALSQNSAEQGHPIVIANGILNDNGEIQLVAQSEFAADVTTLLENGYENLSDVTVVSDAWMRSILMIGETSYQIRSLIQTNETYDDLMDLEIISGDFFSKEDIDDREEVVVISSLSASLLYGSSEAAIGQIVRLYTKSGLTAYTIIGVFKDVSELERTTYGIGDFIFPIGAGLPPGVEFNPVQFGAVIMGRIVNDSVLKAESRIRALLEQEYGEDIALSVWEGSASGPATLLDEGRESVRRFSLAVNILGVIILIISSIGIFSIMLVEVLNRTREIGLRRAMGTTMAGVRRFFMLQAGYYSLLGSILGTGLAFLTYSTIGNYLIPLFDNSGLRTENLNLSVPGGAAVLIAVGAALVFGVLFGFFPAMSASRTSIAECIREDAV